MDGADACRLLTAGLGDLVAIVDDVGTIEWLSDSACEYLGVGREEWVGRNLLEAVHPDDHVLALSSMMTVTSKPRGALIDGRLRRGDGGWLVCEVRGRHVVDDDGDGHIVMIGRDVSDRRALELGRGDDERLRALVHHATALLVHCDRDGVITSANEALNRLFGLDVTVWAGRHLADLVVAEDRDLVLAALDTGDVATRRIAVRLRRADGAIAHLDVSISHLVGDRVVDGFLVSATDVTELRMAEAALRHIADHDALTGLLSRRALLERLGRVVADDPDSDGAHGDDLEVAILFCDLDGFKAVNDELGHEAGDAVLVEVARRLERTSDADDVVARLGGDEFVVVKARCDENQARAAAIRTREALRAPITWGQRVITIDVSIGVATSGDHPTAGRLLATADDAMYRVKRSRPHRREHLRAV